VTARERAGHCAQCQASRGMWRARREDCYSDADGNVFSLADGVKLGITRGSEFDASVFEVVALSREGSLCQACRPRRKRTRSAEKSIPGQLKIGDVP